MHKGALNELVNNCEEKGLVGTAFLALIASIAYDITDSICGGIENQCLSQSFGYFFAKACWIGTCSNQFNDGCYYQPFGRMSQLNPEQFSGGTSHLILKFLQHFFYAAPINQSQRIGDGIWPPEQETQYQTLVRGYYGNFKTTIPKPEFQEMLVQAVSDTGWYSGQWQGFPMSRELIASFVQDAINFQPIMPPGWYTKCDVVGVGEALTDLSLLIVLEQAGLTPTYDVSTVEGWVERETKFMLCFILIRQFTQQLRQLADSPFFAGLTTEFSF